MPRITHFRVATAMLAVLAALGYARAQSAAVFPPSHGPAHGFLVISGGGDQGPDGQEAAITRFRQLAGGRKARIVVIPTAQMAPGPQSQIRMISEFCPRIAPAAADCTVLHATDRAEADSIAFTAPLRAATGVWLSGGRQWRLTDAYLGTRTLTEIFGLLDRGGVVGGGSAGASVQASYLLRGSSNPDDNRILMAPGHEEGFGLLSNSAIDQHVDSRERENGLGKVLAVYPSLLGLGLDEAASVTVHGDLLTVIGPGRVAIWDGSDHDGKGYFYLRKGDTLNLASRAPAFAKGHP